MVQMELYSVFMVVAWTDSMEADVLPRRVVGVGDSTGCYLT